MADSSMRDKGTPPTSSWVHTEQGGSGGRMPEWHLGLPLPAWWPGGRDEPRGLCPHQQEGEVSGQAGFQDSVRDAPQGPQAAGYALSTVRSTAANPRPLGISPQGWGPCETLM